MPAAPPAPGTGESELLAYLERLEERFASRDPELRAFLPEPGRFDRLRAEARRRFERFPDPAARPPLFGVPVGVKDIFHVDGFPTAAGSRLPPEELAGPQAGCVTRLLAAGALIAGKTATTEFAYFAPGPTRNPRHPGHTPGGSSSGSAAAVGAGLCPLALGTQTIGSICRPAAYCGVVGFKPTYGRVPLDGVVPLAPSLDHVGVLAASAELAARAAAVLCDGWRRVRPGSLTGGTAGAAGDSTARSPALPVLGVPEGPYLERAEPAGRRGFEAACERLAAAGWKVRRIPALDDFEAIERRHRRLVAAEAAAVHADWFARYGDRYHPKTRELLEAGRGVKPEQLAADLAGREELRRRLETQMTAEGIDLWVSPAAPGPPPAGLDGTGDPVMNLPWTYAGMPAASLPAGRSRSGLPLGLQLAGRRDADEQLLAWAAELEPVLAEIAGGAAPG